MRKLINYLRNRRLITLNNLIIDPPSEEMQLQALEIYHSVDMDSMLFHGTGRYALGYEKRDKSKINGKITEVLREILSNGIQPAEDIVAKLFLKTPRTVSLANERQYARIYSEMFGPDERGSTNIEYRFLDSNFWRLYYFINSGVFFKRLSILFWLPRVFYNLFSRFKLNEIQQVFNKTYQMNRWYAHGVRLGGNFPLIFGVDKKLDLIKIPKALDIFEKRVDKKINASKIKYLEAPNKFINNVKSFLLERGRMDISLVPMELAEAWSYMQFKSQITD